jgi:hypothetical protein
LAAASEVWGLDGRIPVSLTVKCTLDGVAMLSSSLSEVVRRSWKLDIVVWGRVNAKVLLIACIFIGIRELLESVI